ncbi:MULTISPECIES: hypothetical protein [Sinorhizobium]|uniref:Transmembrane protein n=1 Tax=Sinorhizobium medicae (strain WSM419) TaxID=366394 RepID=A6U924_SINMW|nr:MULTISPECIES: hypothetical protein [Sinorhizobium]ABR60154.1 hypothetical protein Smed_1304 [Sinorhizobium medicae WSM419]MQV62318.1 hypothetical protein [Sinorhizobium meliloti]
MKQRRTFLSEIFSGESSATFDAAKRLSDYVGMLVRLIFLFGVTVYLGKKVTAKSIALWGVIDFTLIIIAVSVGVLSTVLAIAFVATTRAALDELFSVGDYPASSHWYRRGLSITLFIVSSLLTSAVFISVVYQLPLIVRDLAQAAQP